jgi:cytoskeletal protein RodZ
MSQEVSTNPRASKSLSSSKSVQPWSAESDADKLMDDLFSDIDRILDGGSKLPTEPVKPEYVSLQSIVMPQLPTPPPVMATQELVEPSYQLAEVEQPEPVEATLVQTTTPTVIPQAKRSGWSLEKWLLAGGILSLLVALGLLLANQYKLSLPGFLNFSGSSAPESQLPAGDTQFVSYMLRSLQVIENKSKTNQKTANANAVNNQAPVALPTLPAVGSRSPVQNQAPQVLERIYIPVYPPQAPVAQNINPSTVRAAAPAGKPAAKAAAAPVRQSAPAPVKQSAPAPVKQSAAAPARQSAPAPVKQPAPVAVARLAPPPALPALPPAPPPSAVAPAASVSAAPTSQHILVGLMEGDRPAALFDIDGSTQRFYVGESIGASGWILARVENQEAMIRRNGEVRSVFVGQKF